MFHSSNLAQASTSAQQHSQYLVPTFDVLKHVQSLVNQGERTNADSRSNALQDRIQLELLQMSLAVSELDKAMASRLSIEGTTLLEQTRKYQVKQQRLAHLGPKLDKASAVLQRLKTRLQAPLKDIQKFDEQLTKVQKAQKIIELLSSLSVLYKKLKTLIGDGGFLAESAGLSASQQKRLLEIAQITVELNLVWAQAKDTETAIESLVTRLPVLTELPSFLAATSIEVNNVTAHHLDQALESLSTASIVSALSIIAVNARSPILKNKIDSMYQKLQQEIALAFDISVIAASAPQPSYLPSARKGLKEPSNMTMSNQWNTALWDNIERLFHTSLVEVASQTFILDEALHDNEEIADTIQVINIAAEFILKLIASLRIESQQARTSSNFLDNRLVVGYPQLLRAVSSFTTAVEIYAQSKGLKDRILDEAFVAIRDEWLSQVSNALLNHLNLVLTRAHAGQYSLEREAERATRGIGNALDMARFDSKLLSQVCTVAMDALQNTLLELKKLISNSTDLPDVQVKNNVIGYNSAVLLNNGLTKLLSEHAQYQGIRSSIEQASKELSSIAEASSAHIQRYLQDTVLAATKKIRVESFGVDQQDFLDVISQNQNRIISHLPQNSGSQGIVSSYADHLLSLYSLRIACVPLPDHLNGNSPEVTGQTESKKLQLLQAISQVEFDLAGLVARSQKASLSNELKGLKRLLFLQVNANDLGPSKSELENLGLPSLVILVNIAQRAQQKSSSEMDVFTKLVNRTQIAHDALPPSVTLDNLL